MTPYPGTRLLPGDPMISRNTGLSADDLQEAAEDEDGEIMTETREDQ